MNDGIKKNPKKILLISLISVLVCAVIALCIALPLTLGKKTKTPFIPTDLDAEFYSAENWEYMTNNNGASSDVGETVYSLNDGSVKFYRANQAIEIGEFSNETVSFMLKGTNDWSIWFNSSSKDNNAGNNYRLEYANGGLRLVVSTAPAQAAAVVSDSSYEKGGWNRFDVTFATDEKVCSIGLEINGETATLEAGGDTAPEITVDGNLFIHAQPETFTTGNYMAVKVWEANNYVQIKPVGKAKNKDVPVVACIGDSITEGAGAEDFWTESYPSQLQNAVGGKYNVINFGNSGKTAREDLKENGVNVAWINQPQWAGVQAIVPDIVFLTLGTNDSKTGNVPATTAENFKEDYMHIVKGLLTVNPDVRIYICTSPTAYGTAYTISDENITDIIAPVQKEVAEEEGFDLIDLNAYTKNKSLLFPDGIHPSTKGYGMFAEIFNKVLTDGAAGLTPDFKAYIDNKYNDKKSEDGNGGGEVSDVNIIKETNNYPSFIEADSWHDILNDGNEKVWFDSFTNSCILQWGNVYQEIGATSHVSFELWVNAGGVYGFELWVRSTTNDKNVTGKKYIINGYGSEITVEREDGTRLASFPRFPAGTFTRFDITFNDVYESGNLVRTVVSVYQNCVKVALTGDRVTDGSIVDDNPIPKEAGIYFGLKSWEPQIAIRTAQEVSQPNPDAIRVAAVGDSITYGHAWPDQSYPVYLANALGEDYSVGNYGHNGASVTGFGGSWEKYSNLAEYSSSIGFAPDVIVIMLGSNDANGWANAQASYESDLRALITAYKTLFPNAEIILVTSPPTLENNAYGIPNDVVKNSVNPIQRKVAQDMGLTLVDLRKAMEEHSGGYNSFFREGDGVHLSVEGANFVADLIAEAIKSLI